MAEQLDVRHLEGDRFAIEVRGHIITVDQPADAGGEDSAPTPTELFLAGLASCVAFYARRYLARHTLASEGLAVSLHYETGGRPNRVTRISIDVTPVRAENLVRRHAASVYWWMTPPIRSRRAIRDVSMSATGAGRGRSGAA